MKVKDERKANTVPFETIKRGELFTDKDGDFMMKTKSITNTYNETYNAVDLESGDMYTFIDSYPVIPIDQATLTIHN